MENKREISKLNKNDNLVNNDVEKGPINFLIGSFTSFLLFALFYWLSNNIAFYFATHRPTNNSEMVQSLSTSFTTLIVGLSFLATFSFAFIGFGLFIVCIRSFFFKSNKT